MSDERTELIGRVIKHSVPKQWVDVESFETGEVLRLIKPDFFPIAPGDKLHGYYTTEEDELVLIDTPAIVIGTELEDILSVWNKVLFPKAYRSKVMYPQVVEDAHNNYMRYPAVAHGLEQQFGDSELVVEYLSDFCEDVIRCLKQTDREPSAALLEHFPEMTKETCFKFVFLWYNQVTLRRLYALLLTKAEIQATQERYGINASMIYHKLIENPYYFLTIDTDKADSITERYNLDIPKSTIAVRKFLDIDHQRKLETNSILTRLQFYNEVSNLNRILEIAEERYDYVTTTDGLITKQEYEMQLRIAEWIYNQRINQKPFPKFKYKKRSTLSEQQQRALYTGYHSTLSIVTGEGGSGKTTVIESLCNKILDKYKRYLLLAFTGKAVSRLKEKMETTEHTMTIHNALRRELSKVDYIVIDEISMVSNSLFSELLRRLELAGNTNVKVCLVGDSNQLQPTGFGDFFNQLLKCPHIPHIELTQNFRNQNDTLLAMNTKLCWTLQNSLQWGEGFQFIEGGVSQVIELIKEKRWSNKRFKILTPYNATVAEINQEICNTFYKGNQWVKSMIVMMTENNYNVVTTENTTIPVMNGEEGIVTEVTEDPLEVHVKFKLGEAVFTEDKLNERLTPLSLLTKSWCITTHKSQGSEWDHVVLVIPRKSYFINQSLLYTSVSRARKEFYVIALDTTYFTEGLEIANCRREDNLSELIDLQFS